MAQNFCGATLKYSRSYTKFFCGLLVKCSYFLTKFHKILIVIWLFFSTANEITDLSTLGELLNDQGELTSIIPKAGTRLSLRNKYLDHVSNFLAIFFSFPIRPGSMFGAVCGETNCQLVCLPGLIKQLGSKIEFACFQL